MINDLLEELKYHISICELGTRICLDCALYNDSRVKSAITLARHEYDLVREWLKIYPGICIYCAEDSESRDHLVPLSWTGPIARKYVPTVPACQDCNSRIGAACVFTIAGRAEIIAISLRKKYKKELNIEDHSEEWFAEFSNRMAANLRKTQQERLILKRRLSILDFYGAPNINFDLLMNGVIIQSEPLYDNNVVISHTPSLDTTETATETASYLYIDVRAALRTSFQG